MKKIIKKQTITNNSHDSVTKSALTHPKVAQELFQNYLPAELLTYINLEKLRLSSNSFIGKNLQEFISDIVYEVPLSKQSDKQSEKLGDEMTSLAEQWKSEGRSEGSDNRARTIARNILIKKIASVDDVVEITKLPKSVVQKLQKDIK